MSIIRRSLGLLASSALTYGLLSGAALAQAAKPAPDLPTSDSTDLETVVVTARRMEERLQDVPISITVYNQQQLSNRNITSPVDLATYTPSLSTNSRFGPEKASFSIRGFVQDLGTAPSVAFYFADVVAPRANGPTTSGNGAVPGTMFDLQNVQVLKGPQGTLFGRNTTGGAILVVPNRPSDRQEGYVEASAGEYGMWRIQAVGNTPLGEHARLRVGVDHMSQDGYLQNHSGVGPSGFGDINYTGLRAGLVVDATPTLENYTLATYNSSDTAGTLPRVVACARDPALRTGAQLFLAQSACDQLDRQSARGDGFWDVESNLSHPFEKIRQWQLTNTTTWTPDPDLTVKNIASYGEFHEASRINIEGDNFFLPAALTFNLGTAGRPNLINVPTGPGAGQPISFVNIAPGTTGWQAAQSTFTEELQLQGRAFNQRLTWQGGGYVELSGPLGDSTQFAPVLLTCANPVAFQCTDYLGRFAGGTLGSESFQDLKTKYRTLAAYAQGTYKLTDKLSLTGGLRYTSDWTKGVAQNATIRYPQPNTPTIRCTKTGLALPSLQARQACLETITQSSAKPTWLVDLDYKPDDDVLLYAKYARGYRAGLVNLIPTGRAFESAGPEKVDTYEIGAKTTYRGFVIASFNIAAFYNDFTDQQLQANLIAKPGQGVGGNVLVNAGKSVIKGVEIESSVKLNRDLQIDLAYAYLDTELKSITLPTLDPNGIYSAIIPTALVGQPLALSPKNRVTVTGTYTLPLDEALGRVSFAATFTHTDQQFASHADDAFVSQIGFNPGVLPATNLLNLNFNWNSIAGRPIDLSLFATNVTNQKYWVNMTNSYASVGFETEVLGAPRMFGARLRYKFGG